MNCLTLQNVLQRGLVPAALILLSAALADAPAAAQSSSSDDSSPGQYRSQGRYRSQGNYRGSQRNAQPWRPSYYHQNKFYQLTTPLAPLSFTGNPSRSTLKQHGQSYNIVTPTLVLPGYGVYTGPQTFEGAPAPPPPAAPQVYIVQPPAAPAAPTAPPERLYDPPPPSPPPTEPVSTEPGMVVLDVRPAAASVRISNRDVGTGDSLARRSEPLKMKPGVYVVEVEHDGYPSQRLVFGVTPEKTVRVRIDLTAAMPGHRAQVVKGDDGDDFILN